MKTQILSCNLKLFFIPRFFSTFLEKVGKKRRYSRIASLSRSFAATSFFINRGIAMQCKQELLTPHSSFLTKKKVMS